MSSQQLARPGGLPPGLGQTQVPAGNAAQVPAPQSSTAGTEEGHRDLDRCSPDHAAPADAAAVPVREEKQDAVVVRPYPQVQAHGQPLSVAQHLPVQSGSSPITVSTTSAQASQGVPLAFTETSVKFPSTSKIPTAGRLIAPAPASSQGLVTVPSKVPGHVAVESNVPTAPAIPVATISGQQGHSSNVHHLVPANVQIIRSNTPALQMGSSAPPPHTFPSHLPRGAAAAAVMSSSKGATVLRPASGPSTGASQTAMQHILHQPIQARSLPVATSSSTAIQPSTVPPVSTAGASSPVIGTHSAQSSEVVHGRSGLAVHPPPANISVQRPVASRDSNMRITLPSHPAVGVQKPQHTVSQKSIFSTVAPVAAATVAPILATNTMPSSSTTGSVTHTQLSTSAIVTMTMSSHSAHPTAVTSAIPVAKVVPQPVAQTSARIQPDYPVERGNLISISSHRSSPNSVSMEARSDNRQSVPVQLQYFLPTYPPSPYPLSHTYAPITGSVSTIRQYPVTPQAPSSAIPAQAGVGVASTVHLNSMSLMTVDRIGLQSAQINAQGIQPASVGGPSIQPVPGSQQPPQIEAKASAVVLAEGSTLVASPISNTLTASQTGPAVVQTHPHSSGTGSASTLVSSPRPSILRKKPTSEGSVVRKNLMLGQTSEPRVDSTVRSASGSPRPAGVKTKAETHVALTAISETQPGQAHEQQATPSQATSTLLATAGLAGGLSAVPSGMTINPTTLASVDNVALPAQPSASSSMVTCAMRTSLSDIKIKQEMESVVTLPPVASVTPTASPVLNSSGGLLNAAAGDAVQGASPRKKPRKQQHVISTEESEMMEANSNGEEEKAAVKPLGNRAEKRKSPPKEYYDEEGVRYVPVRPRPSVTLLHHYRNPWKAAYHHFQRYSDIRVKEEKKDTLQDMANRRGVVCRAQGWKIHLCAAQLLQLRSLEHDVYDRLTTLQEGLIPKKKAVADDDLHRISELIQGNMQRCQLVMDQVSEARDTMMKVLDHKERVMKLLSKNGGDKKSLKLKRKEKT